nr:malectin-like kinase 4DS-1 [Aegilops tauschii subsp. strangulata]
MAFQTLPVNLQLIALLLSLALAADNASMNSGLILLNCGGSGKYDDVDSGGRTWYGDTGTKFAPLVEGVAASASYQDASLPSTVPYMTARIFSSHYTYSFPVSPGRMFLRLYFYPVAYGNYAVSDAFFGVTAENLVLLNGFNASQTVQAINYAYLVREFSLNVSSGSLDLTFSPSTFLNGSYAFINGIEIVLTPNIFTTATTTFVYGDYIAPQYFTFAADTGFQTMYRLNVGGQAISPKDDTGFYRSWDDDFPYIYGAGYGVTYSKDPNVTIMYTPAVPNYTAPLDVYGTARSMGPDPQVNLNYNLTWILPIDAGFTYLLRLHFCEIQSTFTMVNQRTFNIYVNNQTVEEGMDVISLSGGTGITTYREYFIMASGFGQVDMWIALYPDISTKPQYCDAILNGLEVFKLQDYNQNLAGLNPPVPQKPDMDPNSLSGGTRKSKGDIPATIIGGGVAVLLITFFSTCVIYRRNKVSKSCYKTDCAPNGHLKSRHFSLGEIQLATKSFDEALIIGRGGFGNVYSGEIDGGIKVAIKRLNQGSQQGFHEFHTEIGMLCNFRHGHLVSLIGYCKDENEMILVYDYMPHGTLRDHLYGTRNPSLSWKQRLNICIGAARGLHYLHTGTEQGIIHRDVKTTNILLDDRLMAKVSDFGLSKACTDSDKAHVSTAVKGSFGYFDPEYFLLQRLTKKSDVYSFGVVLFEILCARPVINTELPDEQVSLRDWALSCQDKGVLKQIVDPCVKEEITPECYKIFSELAVKCVGDRSIDRPSMGDVLQNLEAALRLQDNCSRAGEPSSLQIISLVHSDKASTHSVICVAAQEEIFSDIMHPEGR